MSVFGMVVVMGEARADNCTIPGTTDLCTAGGANAICNLVPGVNSQTFNCDLRNNGETTAATGTIVLEATNDFFQAWGTDAMGDAFCCVVDADPFAHDGLSGNDTTAYQNTVALQGGDAADVLAFHYDNGSTEWDLGTFIRNQTDVDATIHGHEEADDIIGSNLGAQNYEEWLKGYTGADVIMSLGGNYDHLEGGEGDDELYGHDDGSIGAAGGDVDPWNEILGGTGTDYIEGSDHGGPGAFDLIYGGSEDDCIYAKAGDDQVYGDGGNDDIQGGYGDDTLFGGLGDWDQIDGDEEVSTWDGYAGGVDAIDCGMGTNDKAHDDLNNPLWPPHYSPAEPDLDSYTGCETLHKDMYLSCTP